MIEMFFNKFNRFFTWLFGIALGYEDLPSPEEVLGEWVEVVNMDCDKYITGKNGNQAKIGKAKLIVEQNTNTGRLRGFTRLTSNARSYLNEEEIGKALRMAKNCGGIVNQDSRFKGIKK